MGLFELRIQLACLFTHENTVKQPQLDTAALFYMSELARFGEF